LCRGVPNVGATIAMTVKLAAPALSDMVINSS
jgi:hypothetical protein